MMDLKILKVSEIFCAHSYVCINPDFSYASMQIYVTISVDRVDKSVASSCEV